LLHGAAGVLPRSSTRWQILAALKLVLSGGAYIPSLPTGPFQPGVIERRGSPVRSSVMDHELTPRQVSVLDLLLAGRSNKEIARTLDLSIGTVKNYVSGLLRTVHAHNRTEAIASFSTASGFLDQAVKKEAGEVASLGDR
jgi:DNA-binding NarL/FixJ family response regulator